MCSWSWGCGNGDFTNLGAVKLHGHSLLLQNGLLFCQTWKNLPRTLISLQSQKAKSRVNKMSEHREFGAMWRKFEQVLLGLCAYLSIPPSHPRGYQNKKKGSSRLPYPSLLRKWRKPFCLMVTPGQALKKAERKGTCSVLTISVYFLHLTDTHAAPAMCPSTSCLCPICLALYSSTVALHSLVSPDVSQDANCFRPHTLPYLGTGKNNSFFLTAGWLQMAGRLWPTSCWLLKSRAYRVSRCNSVLVRK